MAEKADRKEHAAPAAQGAAAGAAAAPAAAGQGKKDGKKASLLASTPLVIGGVMLLEALVLFAGFKFVIGSGPTAAVGADLTAPEAEGHGEGEAAEEGGEGEAAGSHGEAGAEGGEAKRPVDKKAPVEVKVLDFKAPNKQSGRTFLYDVSIYLVTKGKHQKDIEQKLKDRDAMLKDRLRTIIAQSDPEKLGGGSEPGLETLRRQIKYQLSEVVGEGIIDEVLIPRCTPYRADY